MSFKGYKREEKFIRTPYVHTLINDTYKLVFNPTYLIGPYPDAEKQIIVKQSNRSPKLLKEYQSKFSRSLYQVGPKTDV